MRGTRSRGVVSDEALADLWHEHAAALRAFALRLTDGDRAAAEDVVQETLLRAWQHPEALDPARGPLRPWLLTVARHLAVDRHRSRAARPPESALPDDLESPDDELERALESWLVADALAALTPVHREALLHTFWAGRTVNEAAAVLGVPAGTVKSRVFYALRALRLALEERGTP